MQGPMKHVNSLQAAWAARSPESLCPRCLLVWSFPLCGYSWCHSTASQENAAIKLHKGIKLAAASRCPETIFTRQGFELQMMRQVLEQCCHHHPYVTEHSECFGEKKKRQKGEESGKKSTSSFCSATCICVIVHLPTFLCIPWSRWDMPKKN